MKPLRFLLFLLVFGSAAQANIDRDIRALLADRLLERATVGLHIVQLGESPRQARTLFTLNAQEPLIPASNMKVLTTTVALERLGADFRFRTMLVQRGSDLVIVGDGDPSFGDAEMLKKVGWDVTTVYESWAQVLQKRNITTVRDVLVDDSVFDEEFFHPNWDSRQSSARYAAQVAGLCLNVNCVDFYLQPTALQQPVRYHMKPATAYVQVIRNTCLTSAKANEVSLARLNGANRIALGGQSPGHTQNPLSVSVHDPALYGATVLAETLAGAGIRLGGSVKRDRTIRAQLAAKDPACVVLAVHETPLATVIARTNKESMNVYAESLCKRTGFAATGQSGTWANGTAAAAALLRHLEVPQQQFQLDDGCGLSRRNALSAAAIVRLLVHNHHSRHAKVFLDSLPVAGRDGTLERRFENSDLRGRVFAKTGFISQVRALSGYLHGRDQRWYAFSILLNHVPEGTKQSMNALMENILKTVDAAAPRGP
jgi:D-alanyl-D-alanine carboxypeptidase/D-alanyl-D-alanine-endopeptidase (penicillin-binding protein 4)